MLDLLKTADKVRQLLSADSICLWSEEAEGVAVPVVSSPPAWLDRPFVLSSSLPTGQHCVREGALAHAMLPLSARGQTPASALAGALDVRLQLDAGPLVGLLAVWHAGQTVPAGAQELASVVLSTLGLLIRKASASTNFIETNPVMYALAGALPQGIVLVPLDGRMGYANASAASLLQIPEGESTPALLSQALRRFVERALNADEVTSYATRVLNRQPMTDEQRSMTWRFAQAPQALRVTITPVGVPQQTAWAWLLDDVSQETALRDRLASQEQKFRFFYQRLRDAVIAYGLDGRAQECNSALGSLMGLPDLEAEALTPEHLGWTPQGWAEVLQECLTHGYAAPREREIVSAAGLHMTVEAVAHLRRNAANEADGIWEVLHDITARKNAEAQLILSAEAFARHSDGVVLTDAHSVILTNNDAFSMACGYSREELRGRKPSMFKSGRHDEKFYDRMRHDIATVGWWQGGVWNRHKNGDLFFKWLSVNAIRNNEGQVTHFVGIYRDAATVKKAQDRIQYLATHDELTQLPNKVLFEDRLQSALLNVDENGRLLAVLLLDLDGFQQVNSALGYSTGDGLLKEVAARLLNCEARGHTVARLSGNTFGVLLTVSGLEELADYAERLLQGVNAPHPHADAPIVVPGSLGISVHPADGHTPEALLMKADVALRRAKEHGAHGYQFFAEDMADSITRRFEIENGLRRALERNELFLHYQAQLALADGSLAGCEALVRWRRPDGVVPPGVFIPVAEMSSLIIPITDWVVRQACRDLRQWDAQGVVVPAVSINISAKHFQSEKMVPSLLQILHEERVSPSRVCLEITEGAMADPEYCESKLAALKQAGFSLSVDDFGTGFSSLSYLKRFRLDELKIDQSFVRGIGNDAGDRAIVNATLSMAHSLGMRVVAEGVEQLSQADYLRERGCDLVQGYLFARPVSAAELMVYAQQLPQPSQVAHPDSQGQCY